MTDAPSPAETPPVAEKPPCAWCAEPSVTVIYTEGNPETKHKRTAPVCVSHERIFLAQGAVSMNVWFDEGWRREWKAKHRARNAA